jgi:hypothetical protein
MIQMELIHAVLGSGKRIMECMSNRMTLAFALAAGFIGGTISQRIVPTAVLAQDQKSVPDEIRAHKFVLVDEAGVNRGVFGFYLNKTAGSFPGIEYMDTNGNTHAVRISTARIGMLPDATCKTCTQRP